MSSHLIARAINLLRRGAALTLLGLAMSVGAACGAAQGLTRQEVDNRAYEYFQRGMDQFQRGEFRPALESFRLARAYDLTGANPTIVEMIDKTEVKLRISNGPAVAAAPNVAPPPPRPTAPRPAEPTAAPAAPPPETRPQPTATEKPALPNYRTYRSRLYPYALEIPDNWTVTPAAVKVAEAPADLIEAPAGGAVAARLTVVAHLLPNDVDRRAYVEANTKLLRREGVQADEFARRTVDGFEASLLRARYVDEQGKMIATFAIFASEQVGWRLTLTASAEESDRLQPLFQRILDSFRVSVQQSFQ